MTSLSYVFLIIFHNFANMKPKKNHIYCPAAGRSKMLFESESKARNFIKFNAEAILNENNHAPMRAYYCETCCGWHVTHRPSYCQERDLRNSQKVVGAYHDYKAEVAFAKREEHRRQRHALNDLKELKKTLSDIINNVKPEEWNPRELLKLHARFTYLAGELKASGTKRSVRQQFECIEYMSGGKITFPNRAHG